MEKDPFPPPVPLFSGGECPVCRHDVGLWPYLRVWSDLWFPCPNCGAHLTSDGMRFFRRIAAQIIAGMFVLPPAVIVFGKREGLWIRFGIVTAGVLPLGILAIMWLADTMQRQNPPRRDRLNG